MVTLTPVQHTPEAQPGEEPRPNKYRYDEFAGFDGERRLKAILRKILPMALYRTWEIFDAAQAPGNDCYLGTVRASEAAERVLRTIRRDLHEFEARQLLMMRAGQKLLHQLDGSYLRKPVVIKDFSGLYRLAHEYYLWTHSDDYIEPDRDFAPLILADEHLVEKLRRYNNYRRILCTQVPGPKASEREEHRWYTDYEEDAEEAGDHPTNQIGTNKLPKELSKQLSKDSTDREESNKEVEPLWRDSNSTGFAETPKGTVLTSPSPACSHIAHGTIRHAEATNESTMLESHRTSNHIEGSREMAASAGAAKTVEVHDDVQSMAKAVAIPPSPAPLAAPPVALSDEAHALPVYLEGTYLIPLSKEWHDKAPRSSATRLAKSYWRMHAYGMDEFAFGQLLDRPAKKTRTKLGHDHVPNPIGYFFTVLENDIKALCTAWDEELHQCKVEDVQVNTPALQEPSLEHEAPSLPAQGMARQDEAEALIERIQREIGDIADLRLWDAAARACQGRYVVDLDLEFSPEPDVVHRWSETFATPTEWTAYYAEQTRNRDRN
jgi:hypothetical protein